MFGKRSLQKSNYFINSEHALRISFRTVSQTKWWMIPDFKFIFIQILLSLEQYSEDYNNY